MTPTHPARWRAVVGLIAAPVAWVLHHQLASNLDYADCRRGITPLSLAVGIGGLVVIAIATGVSLPAGRTSNADHLGRFIGRLSLIACALFAMTILVQLGATLILPPCYK